MVDEGIPLSASKSSHRYLWGTAVDQLMADEQVSNSDLVVWALDDNLNTVRDLAVYASGVTTVVTETDWRIASPRPSDGDAAIRTPSCR